MTQAIRGLPDCEPKAFSRADKALAFVAGNASEIGIAITDYDMPGMNGVGFIRAPRQVEGFAHVPIVMVTSNEARALRREALEAGTTDFLQKPFDAVEVRARITNLLALDRARQAEGDRAACRRRHLLVRRSLRPVHHRPACRAARVIRRARHPEGVMEAASGRAETAAPE